MYSTTNNERTEAAAHLFPPKCSQTNSQITLTMSKRLAKVTVQQLPRLLISTHVAWFASKQKSVQHCQQLCSTMSKKASINGYSAWSNMRLVRGDCETEDILKDIMSGVRMKVLLEGCDLFLFRINYCSFVFTLIHVH